MKHRLLLGTAGHIDHGKTALVKALTGVDTDRLPDEKARQITIDLGFAPLELDDYLLGIVDVPGHERFVKNMLAGATGVDLAMLVVAVDDSVKPQTREHLEILEYLRLPAGVIALTKCDLAASDWIDLVETEVRELVVGTFLENAALVRVSAQTGEGLCQLRDEISGAADIVVARQTVAADVPFRMAIDRAFTIAGHGTVVTGGVASGQVRVGDRLVLEPQGTAVRVRGLQNHDTTVDQLGRGQRAAINLSGIHYNDVARGQCLATPDSLRPSRLVTVQLKLSEHAARPLKPRQQVRLHVGTSETLARVGLLGCTALSAGEKTFAQLFLAEEVAVAWGQPFVLRAVSPMETLGGGRVLDGAAVKIKRLHDEIETRLTDWASDDPPRRAAAAAFFAGTHPWQPADLFTLAGVGNSRAVVETLLKSGVLRQIVLDNGELRLLHETVLGEICDRIERVLQVEHQKTPLRTFVERSRVASHFANLETPLLTALFAQLANEGRILTEPRGLTLAGWQPDLSQGQQHFLEQMVESYRTARLDPPGVTELCSELGQRSEVAIPLLELAVEQQSLVRMTGGVFLHCDAVQQAKSRVGEQLADGARLTVSEIRELLGMSRKTVVPLCEYLDAVGFTRREGNVRQLANRSPNSVK